jgi:hypothetical protein
MAEPQTPDRPAPAEEKLFTLSEVSQRTGISMPTLQRYKKTYQGRIPSEGVGRKQRYPEHALPVFAELRTENAGKRGRPRKNAAAAGAAPGRATAKTGARRPRATAKRRAAGRGRGKRAAAATAAAPAAPRRRGRPPRAAGAAAAKSTRATGRRAAAGARRGPGRPRKLAPAKRGPGRPPGRRPAAGRRPGAAAGRRSKTAGLLTLTSISKTTGISYPTLVRYVRLYSNRLPHEGKGRARRFHPEAVDVFRSLRQQSGRGGRRAGAGARRGAPGTARRGRPPKSAGITGRVESILAKRVRDLEKFQKAVEKRFGKLVKGLQNLR